MIEGVRMDVFTFGRPRPFLPALLVLVLCLGGCDRAPTDVGRSSPEPAAPVVIEPGDKTEFDEDEGGETSEDIEVSVDDDTSSDEYVKALISEDQGRPVRNMRCIRRSETFDEVILRGGHATGIGCRFTAIYVDEVRYGDMEEGVSELLSGRGWSELPTDERKELARAAVVEILSYASRVHTRPNTAFDEEDTPDYAPLQISVDHEDQVVVTVWTSTSRQPRSGNGTATFIHFQYVFGADGSVESTHIDSFSIDSRRVQGKSNIGRDRNGKLIEKSDEP